MCGTSMRQSSPRSSTAARRTPSARRARTPKTRHGCWPSSSPACPKTPNNTLENGETPMKLTPEQLREFDEQGFLFLPSLFNAQEMDILNREVPGILAAQRPEVIKE